MSDSDFFEIIMPIQNQAPTGLVIYPGHCTKRLLVGENEVIICIHGVLFTK